MLSTSTVFQTFFFNLFHVTVSTAENSNVRARRQFGNKLEHGVEHINSGIGPHLIQEEPVQVKVPKLTHTFDDEMSFELAGTLVC